MSQITPWGSRPRPRTAEPTVRSRHCAQVLGAFVVGAVVQLAAAPNAHATCRGRNFVDSLSLTQTSRPTVRVTSGNGVAYDRIETVSFTSHFRINLCREGALDGVIVHFGQCSGHTFGGCKSNKIMFLEVPSARDFIKDRTFFPFAIPPESDTGRNILESCNAVAADQRKADRDTSVGQASFLVTLGVDTRREPGALGDSPGVGSPFGVVHGIVEPDGFRPLQEYSKTGGFLFTANVACAPIPQPVLAPPKIAEAALSVAASGDTCPKQATADVIIAAQAPRPVFYKIERGNGATTTADWIEGKIRMQKGPTGSESAFLRDAHDLGGLDPGERKFRLWIDGWGKTPWRTVNVECPPFKVTSAWLKYEVQDKATCPKNASETAIFKATRPGKAQFEIKTQGGLVVHSGIAAFEREGMGYVAKVERPSLSMNVFDQDMMALIKDQPDANSGWVRLKVECLHVLSGTLDLRGFAANRCEGEVALSIRTSMPASVPYQLDCTGGRSWSGTAQSQQTGPDTHLGVDTMRFEVANKEHVNCALKTRGPLPAKVLALKGRTYECHRPSGVTGTSDLAPKSQPDPQGPRGSPIVVDTPKACPQGTLGKWPNCMKQACPHGTVGKWPQCKTPSCPPGQVRVRGRCIKSAG